MSTADDRDGVDDSPHQRTVFQPRPVAPPEGAAEATSQRPADPAPSPLADTAAGSVAEPSFDPKSWAGDHGAARAKRKGPPLALVGAGVAALVVAGGAAVFLNRQPAAVTPTKAAAAPAVVEPVAAPAPPPAALESRTLTIAGPAGLAPALTAFGVAAAEASAAAAAATPALAGSNELRLEVSLAGAELHGLIARRADTSGVELIRTVDGDFSAKPIVADVRTEVRVARGELDDDSFYSSAVAAGVNDALIPAFAQAFTFDFDFQRELKPGDVFEAVYEEAVNAEGQPAASGQKRLLYVSLTTAAKSRALYRFTPPGEAEEGWFDGAGKSVVRSIMRTPVDGARISSQFGPRVHPIRGYVKNHNGTDFAAPAGTAIYAASDGVVEFAALKGCNGNFTVLRHDTTNWQTYYLHQIRFAEGIAPGVRVSQGQRIGDVGTTGCSTGPHLHYEVRIEGQPTDPLKIEVSEGKSLSGPALAAFVKERDRIDLARKQAL